MGTVIHANAKSIHELAAKPAGDTAQEQREHLDQKDSPGRRHINGGTSGPPDEREQRDNEHVTAAVQQADALRAGAVRNGPPIDEPKDRGQQPSDDSRGDVPITDRSERRVAAPEVHSVENDRTVVGFRQTNGWARTRTVYFAMEFSKPFASYGFRELFPAE